MSAKPTITELAKRFENPSRPLTGGDAALNQTQTKTAALAAGYENPSKPLITNTGEPA